MKIVSFQQNINTPNLLEGMKKSVPVQTVSVPPVADSSNSVAAADSANTNYKNYAYVGLGVLSLGILILKSKSIVNFFKKIFKPVEKKTPATKPPTTIETNPPTPVIKVEKSPLAPEPKPTDDLKKDTIDTLNEETTRIFSQGFRKYYQKLIPLEAQKEVYASQIYGMNNVKVPEMKLLGSSFDPKGLEREFIESLRNIPGGDIVVYKRISEDFAADVLLGNTNVLKSAKLTEKGDVIRLKLQNTFGTNSSGSSQNWSYIPDEIADFLNPEKYPENAEVFSVLTREDFIKSLKKLTSVRNKDYKYINTLNDNAKDLNGVRYLETVLNRELFLQKILTIAERTEQKALSVFEYVETVKNQALKKTIKESSLYHILADLKRAVENIKDNEVKAELISLLKARIESLTIKKENPKHLSIYETGQMLEKYFHKVYQLSVEEIKILEERYGKKSYNIIRALKTPLSQEKIVSMAYIANSNNGKYRDFWLSNPENMVIYLNSHPLSAGQYSAFQMPAWNTVTKAFKHFCENKYDDDALDAVIDYSGFGSYNTINGVLRVDWKIGETLKLLDGNINENTRNMLKQNVNDLKRTIKKHITLGNPLGESSENCEMLCKKADNILEKLQTPGKEDYVQIKNELQNLKDEMNSLSEKYKIKDKIRNIQKISLLADESEKELSLIRQETTDAFESLYLDGEKLSDLMLTAGSDPQKIEKVLAFFNERKPVLEQPGFLSTSIAPYSTLDGNVVWSLTPSLGTEYRYVSDLSHVFGQSNGGTEAEMLFSPGHKIHITGAKKDGRRWCLKGIILPR